MTRWIAATLVLAACGTSRSELSVDVVSDLVAGYEVATLRVELRDRNDVVIEEQALSVTENLADGVRAADLEARDGVVELRVAALDLDGRTLVSRSVVTKLAGDTGITVILTRSCAGIECGSITTCHGGRCVDPSCTRENVEACGVRACTEASECPASAACAQSACLDGSCVAFEEGGCGAGQYCNPVAGCIDAPDAGPGDASTDVSFDVAEADGGPDARPDCSMVLPASITSDFEVPFGCIVSVPENVLVGEGAFLTIQAGARLEVDPNVTIQIARFGNQPEYAAGIEVLGTATDPVVFTTSASRPAPGSWDGLVLHSELLGPSVIEFARFEYGGGHGDGALYVHAAIAPGSLSVRDSVFENNLNEAISLDLRSATFADATSGTFAELARNQMRNNGDYDLSIPAATLADLDPSNSLSSPIRVADANITTLVQWSEPGVPIHLTEGIDVDAGGQLVIEPGVLLRFASGVRISVAEGGTFTADEVVFESALASPGPGDWCGVYVGASAGAVRVSGCTFRHAGSCLDGVFEIYYSAEPFPAIVGTTFEMNAGAQNIFVTGTFADPSQCTGFTTADPPNTFDQTACATD